MGGKQATIKTHMITKLMASEEEPQHSLGWHDNVKENPVQRDEFNGTDKEYEDYCEACAI